MNEEELRKLMQSGFDKVTPKVAIMTNLIMDAYQEGFKCCWKLFTGEEFK